eukprot:8284107-Alexandrium_andersonii.AAC.1
MLSQQRQLGLSGSLNYQRRTQGKLNKFDRDCAQSPDRLVFHQRYADFRIDERGHRFPKDMRVRIPSRCLGQNHRDV